MSTVEIGEHVTYIPADERRLAGARDVGQTAARLRPLLRDVFKTGGFLDELNLGNAEIEDHDSLNSYQMVAGVKIEAMFASRNDRIAYASAEMGYLRHAPNLAEGSDYRLNTLLCTIREIALASSIYLDLPPVPTVTFDPIQIPPPSNPLFIGVVESFTPESGLIQPLKTYPGNKDTVQPLLMWKIDPYPSYWSDLDGTVASRRPLNQGDIIISHTDERTIRDTAQTVIFAQSHSQEYRSLVREHIER